MPNSYTEGPAVGAAILSEGQRHISREVVTFASGVGKVAPNTVVAKFTSGGNAGKWGVYTPGATDGTQTAAAVTIYGADATSADATAVVLKRMAEVKIPELIWGAAVTTAAHKTTAYDALANSNIIAR